MIIIKAMVRQLSLNYKSIKYSKYLSSICLILTLLVINTITVYAQPGGGTDPLPCGPDDPCPLDTWIIALTIGALIFTTAYLYRKQKNILLLHHRHTIDNR